MLHLGNEDIALRRVALPKYGLLGQLLKYPDLEIGATLSLT